MATRSPGLLAGSHVHLLGALLLAVVGLIEPASTSVVQNVELVPQSAVKDLQQSLRSSIEIIVSLTRQRYVRAINGQLGMWDAVQLIAACSLIGTFRLWKKRQAAQNELTKTTELLGVEGVSQSSEGGKRSSRQLNKRPKTDAEITDPGLLRKYSSIKSYTTTIGTYPSIRTFYRPHPQADKLPSKPTPIPLLVFIHGLGGSLAQFHPLMTSLVNVAPCLGIDLPGCGLSTFLPKAWNYYSLEALAELIATTIKEHCENEAGQGVILIGHSLGCSLSVVLASEPSLLRTKGIDVLALIGICPKASPPSAKEVRVYERLLRVPTPIFDIWRSWDRRGGSESASVARFVGPSADIETKKLQERFNTQSQTAVWRRMAWGTLPKRRPGTASVGGIPGLDVWASLSIPIFLIAGEADNVTKASEIADIGRVLGKVEKPTNNSPTNATVRPSEDGPSELAASTSVDVVTENQDGDGSVYEKYSTSNTETTIVGDKTQSEDKTLDRRPSFSKRRQVLKTSILPAPASHALLYDSATYRTLAGLIRSFLYEHVDSRLSLGWQLQHLSTEGKWDVKNLAKWQAISPVSEPIARIFRAMKTLREIDDVHSPAIFVRDWKGKLKAVIDISHENPVYDPKKLDEGGIEYHKFPTVSKIPPTAKETKDFIKLVDRLRSKPSASQTEIPLIGVHCHYGFNRTGFFVCSYLIEKENFGVQQAIDEFRTRRPPGIRHEHFLDTLFVRYCVGLKRAPTL